MKCPLCFSPLKININKDYFDCSTCSAIVKEDKKYITAIEEKKFYQLHNNDVNDERYQKFTSPITNYILEKYNKNDSGLDFGSGTGPVISKVLEDKGFKNIHQYDPYFCPDKNVLKTPYNFIFSCEVVEHFKSPYQEYERLFKLLKKGGRLIIMTLIFDDSTDFNEWYYKDDPTHIFIHRKETFEYIAKKFGATIEYFDGRLIVLKKVG